MRSLPRRVITAAKPAYAPVRASAFGAPFWLPLGLVSGNVILAGLLHHEVL